MQDGPKESRVTRWLEENAPRVSFFQLVRLLQRSVPGSAPPGGEGPPSREPMRFRPSVEMGFAPGDIESLETAVKRTEEGAEERFYRLTLNFMGLYGATSPLPNHMTESVLWEPSDNSPRRDFLDIFHHRLISFVYRAWARARHYIQYDAGGTDRFTHRAFSLIGMGTDGQRAAWGVGDLELLRAAGLLTGGSRSAAGLEGMLRDHFENVPIEIESFVPRAVRIPAQQRMRLGMQGSRLAEDAHLGEAVQDCGGMFRVKVGPVASSDFRRFLPGAPAFARLVRLVRLYVPDYLDFEVELRLKGGETPALRLGEEQRLPLGHMSWLAPRSARDEAVTLTPGALDPIGRAG